MKQLTVEWVQYGGRCPRKIKKRFLGNKMSSGRLKKLLASVTIGTKTKTMYEQSDIRPYTFCPHCGCVGMVGSGNKTSYPEHWEYFHCIRCRKVVGYIDNSPFIHALECKEFNYDPTF